MTTLSSTPAMDVSIEIKPKEIFCRKFDPQLFHSSHLRCTICNRTFESSLAINNHLRLHMFSVSQDQSLTQRYKFLLKVTLRWKNTLACFEIRNIGHSILNIGNVYVLNRRNSTLKAFDDCVLKSGETTCFDLAPDLIDPNSINTIIIQVFNGDLEYFEHRELGVCCHIPNEIIKKLKLKTLTMCKDLTTVLAKSDAEVENHFRSKEEYTTQLDHAKYESIFSELSMVERISNQLELDTYHQENVTVKQRSYGGRTSKDLYEVCVLNVKDKMSRLSEFDRVKFTQPATPDLSITGNIYELLKDLIVFEKFDKSKQFDPKLVYNMTFHINQYPYDMESAALQLVYNDGIVQHLFPKVVDTQLPSYEREFCWFNNDIVENPLQMQAVHHIVQGTAHPAPYILFGPPGTGKTKTLVEAISQIYMHCDNSRMLVCATSNAGADELALRIIKNLPNSCWNRHHMYRIYSSSYEPEVPIPMILRESSNFDLKYCPELKFLKKFRIIVATLLMGGSLRYAKLESDYFTHLFIDECGSAKEISTLVPIACAPNAQIVLSGDPKQLGPVVLSKHADDLGLGLSLLERLIEANVYQPHPKTNLHNPNVLTKLQINYRSHAAIISPSNKLFYNGELVAKGNIQTTHCFVDWPYLPSPGTPIIFHACIAKSQRENGSMSIFNMHEIAILLKYVELIMNEQINGKKVRQDDIGIISPYKKQCYKIKENLGAKNLSHIMVGTVEKFQGKEKPIILVTTVRCQMGGIGFLRNPKRLNVLLTRAQCLMIIVGDPNTLKSDKNWREVLREFKETGVCTGVSFGLEKRIRKRANKYRQRKIKRNICVHNNSAQLPEKVPTKESNKFKSISDGLDHDDAQPKTLNKADKLICDFNNLTFNEKKIKYLY